MAKVLSISLSLAQLLVHATLTPAALTPILFPQAGQGDAPPGAWPDRHRAG